MGARLQLTGKTLAAVEVGRRPKRRETLPAGIQTLDGHQRLPPAERELGQIQLRDGDLEGRLHLRERLERVVQVALGAVRVLPSELDPPELPVGERDRPWVAQLL